METGCRLALVGALCIAGLSMLVAILREHGLRRDSQHSSDRGVAHLLGVGWQDDGWTAQPSKVPSWAPPNYKQAR